MLADKELHRSQTSLLGNFAKFRHLFAHVHARSLHWDKTAFQWTPLIANFKFSTNESSRDEKFEAAQAHGEQNFVKPQITGDYGASLDPRKPSYATREHDG
jgi:hypothetical protein